MPNVSSRPPCYRAAWTAEAVLPRTHTAYSLAVFPVFSLLFLQLFRVCVSFFCLPGCPPCVPWNVVQLSVFFLIAVSLFSRFRRCITICEMTHLYHLLNASWLLVVRQVGRLSSCSSPSRWLKILDGQHIPSLNSWELVISSVGTPSLFSFGGREAQESHQCTPAGTGKKKKPSRFHCEAQKAAEEGRKRFRPH